MYRSLHQLLPNERPVGKTKSKVLASYSAPEGLSVNLTQMLHKSLYRNLCQYGASTQSVSILHPPALINALSPLKRSLYQASLRHVSVRNVLILPGESVSHIFSPENGLVSEPTSQGRMLLLTNRRIIIFGQKAGVRETVLIPAEEIKGVSVNTRQRSKGTLFQGGVLIAAAVLFYVILAYWLTGRITGPQVPIIRMDLVAFVAFLAVLTGVAVLAQMYFAKPESEVLFHGDGVKFTFPFKEETSQDEIYVLVNAVFNARKNSLG